MSTSSARRVAGTALAWGGAALYPFVLYLTMFHGSHGFQSYEVLASVVLTLVTASLLRRAPLPALAVLLLAWVAAALAHRQTYVAGLQIVVADAAVAYIAATRRRWTAAVAALLTLVTQLLSAAAFPTGPDLATHALLVVVLLGAAWTAGRSVHDRRAHERELRARATERAVDAERLRIARELHDMVAHSIGIIAIQAGVGGRVIETQPAEARRALNAIEDTSRETLAGLRRMLGALRRTEPAPLDPAPLDPAPLDPAPGVADLARLAAATADAGVRVDLRWRGERRPLPPDLDVSAYRIVQEAVTNVVRHAGVASCRVTVSYGPAALSVEVEDDGRGAARGGPGGYGLTGMRERAGLLGGTLAAGPRPGGGFRVAARLPLPEAAA
ncbi:sensor histidine kinase [Actinomadura atramentaria]|uniref:sensor histidine kinase n=1 Tax=Actinomadura atramentaria TaxID=1990 RepID=UPI0003709091|nr:histidine kinase [Actinomadura atramentaria]